MKYIFTSLLAVSILVFSNTGLSYAVVGSNLPDGSALTPENLDAYKSSDTFQNLTIRKGAKMSKTMNFDDCFKSSIKLCVAWGPCKKKVLGIGIKIPSFGADFKYWEPNAIVETVCSQGNSYYTSDLNLSSRMVGKKMILGEKATIAGLPAEKCVETIKTGGGMQGAGAQPRYFNETHVWGVGLIPRFTSSATFMEALISAVCGYAGIVGGMFDAFSGSAGDSGIADGEMSGVSDSFTSGMDGIGETGSWMNDAFDTYTDVSEGFEGMTGMDLTSTLVTAGKIGMIAMTTMENQAPIEVRPEELCKEKEMLEGAANKNAEVTAITSDKENFDIGLFTEGYNDGGVCPLGITNGYTLEYSSTSLRGVNQIRVKRSSIIFAPGVSSKSMSGKIPRGAAVRVSQVEVDGLFPACEGTAPSGTRMTVYPVATPGNVFTEQRWARDMRSSLINNYNGLTLAGYSTKQQVQITTQRIAGRKAYDYDGDFTTEYGAIPATSKDIPPQDPRYDFSTEYAVGDSKVRCWKARYQQTGDPSDDPIEISSAGCDADVTGVYIEAYDHRGQLNDYMTNTTANVFDETDEAANKALDEVNKRIEDLGGDCDSGGKPAGTWGDAVLGATYQVAVQEGLAAAEVYIKASPEYQNLKKEATEYAQQMQDKLVNEFSDATQGIRDNFAEVADDITESVTGVVDDFSDVYIKAWESASSDVAEVVAPLTDAAGELWSSTSSTVSSWFSSEDGEGGALSGVTDYLSDGIDEFLPDLGTSMDDVVGDLGDIDVAEAIDFVTTAMDIAKMAAYDGALKQAALGIASSYDPTGLWPGFTSEMSALSWRGKNIPNSMKIKGMIGTLGHLPCAVSSIATDIAQATDFGAAYAGGVLSATEDFLGCVGTWGPLEPQTGFVYHRDSKVAAALAGYRGYKLAVSLFTIKDHPQASGEPMKINLDFPHKSKCFVPGTADPRWESKYGLDPLAAIKRLPSDALDYVTEPLGELGDLAQKGINAFSGDDTEEDTSEYADDDAYDDEDDSILDVEEQTIMDDEGNLSTEFKQIQADSEGMVFTYWRKSKCCLYLVGYWGYGYDYCFKVERSY